MALHVCIWLLCMTKWNKLHVNKHFVINFEWHRHFKADEFTIIFFWIFIYKIHLIILTRSLKLIWGVEKFRPKFFFRQITNFLFLANKFTLQYSSFFAKESHANKNNQCTLMAALTIPFDRKEFAPFICSKWSKSNSYISEKQQKSI